MNDNERLWMKLWMKMNDYERLWTIMNEIMNENEWKYLMRDFNNFKNFWWNFLINILIRWVKYTLITLSINRLCSTPV